MIPQTCDKKGRSFDVKSSVKGQRGDIAVSDVHTSGAQIMTIIKSISKSSETSKGPRVHSVAVVVKFVVAMRGSTGTGNKCEVLTWTFATPKEKKMEETNLELIR
jgi:hypothetical protein